MPSMDDLRDCQRDLIALLRAYNAANGQLDDASRVILANTDTMMLAKMLLATTYGLAVEQAKLAGCTTDDEIRDVIEKHVASLQAQIIGDPDILLRDDGPDEPQG